MTIIEDRKHSIPSSPVTTAPEQRLTILLTGTVSDAHTWNLVFLSMLLEEWGHHVVVLSACVPEQEVVDACQRINPDLIVVSSVNGHGYPDGLRLIAAVRELRDRSALPVVIGGKLGIAGDCDATRTHALMAAGYDAVFDDIGDGTMLASLDGFISRLHARPRPPGLPS
ncbi:cobalamin B12-binding domain-containing protein [Nocardia sp. NPDC052566]|uniref:cobalamin B12-binding domain-containing protein n=1 Tax=Nocardia sp. NPDC052566 TaxID=3364330 RepID=UPI0037C9AF12